MKSKREFTEIAKRLLGKRTGLRSPQLIHPQREWIVGLLVAIVVFGLAAAWSAHMYLAHKSKTVQVSIDPADEVVVYREAMVQSALEYFAEREQAFNTLYAEMAQEVLVPEPEPILETASTTEVEVPTELGAGSIEEEVVPATDTEAEAAGSGNLPETVVVE